MTKPIRIVSRWDRFKRLWVWHPINTDPKDEERWTVRVWLPLYDVLAMLAAWRAFDVGSAVLYRLFPGEMVDICAAIFGTAGFVTLVGVIIPKLWRVEVIGKITMSFMLTTYALLILAFPSNSGQDNSFVTIILIMATWGVYPRLTKLFMRGYREARARKQAKALAKARTANRDSH